MMAISIDEDGVKKELNSLVLDIGNTFKKAIERALVFYAKQGEAGEKNHKAATVVLQLYDIEYSRLSSYAKVGERMSFDQSKIIVIIWRYDHCTQCTKVLFASYLSGGFITATGLNLPERKLAKRTSAQCSDYKQEILL